MSGRRLRAPAQHRLRRAAALAAAWVLLGAAPAGAHDDVGSIGADAGDPTTISGTAEAGNLGRVTRIDLTVRPTGGQAAEEQTEVRCVEGDCGQSAEFSWTLAMPYNGPYQAVADVEHCTDLLLVCNEHSGQRTIDFTVEVPPVPPDNVSARAGGDRKVTVTWDEVTAHPDLVGYVVLRRSGDGAFRPLGLVTDATSYLDDHTALAGGKFDYQVASVREGAVPGDPESWLTSGSHPVSVDVAGPPANPSHNSPSGSNNGGGGPGDGIETGPSADTLAAGSDLSSFLSSAAAGLAPPPASLGDSVAIPDTGFSENLPFPEGAGPRVEGRQAGRPSSASGSGGIEEGGLSDSNRRALLVPIAGGSVLCVTALHLRWLTRRLTASAAGLGSLQLEPAEPEPGLDPDSLPDREPVGAGAGGGGDRHLG